MPVNTEVDSVEIEAVRGDKAVDQATYKESPLRTISVPTEAERIKDILLQALAINLMLVTPIGFGASSLIWFVGAIVLFVADCVTSFQWSLYLWWETHYRMVQVAVVLIAAMSGFMCRMIFDAYWKERRQRMSR